MSTKKKKYAKVWKTRSERAKERKEVLDSLEKEDIVLALEPKVRRVNMENYHMFRQEYHEILTGEELDDLADQLFKWYDENRDATKATKFLVDFCISYHVFYRWLAKCPKLNMAWEYVKMAIGNKREDDAYHRKADAKVVLFTLANYCPETNKMLKEEREQSQGGPQQIRVVVDTVENSPLVPPLRSADGREESSSEELHL